MPPEQNIPPMTEPETPEVSIDAALVGPAAPASGVPSSAPAGAAGRGGPDLRHRRNERDSRRPSRRRETTKVRPEFDQKILDIRRVARVVAGGRRFSFSVALAAGDHKGAVGVGLGKAGDTALAIEKALKNAKKNIIRIPLTKSGSIPYETSAKFSASRVSITPAPGRGIVAGSSVRALIELAGIKDVGAKIQSPSKNRLNNARAAIEALRLLTPHRLARKAKAASAAAAASQPAVAA